MEQFVHLLPDPFDVEDWLPDHGDELVVRPGCPVDLVAGLANLGPAGDPIGNGPGCQDQTDRQPGGSQHPTASVPASPGRSAAGGTSSRPQTNPVAKPPRWAAVSILSIRHADEDVEADEAEALERSGLSSAAGMVRCWATRKPQRAPKIPKMAPEAPALTRSG